MYLLFLFLVSLSFLLFVMMLVSIKFIDRKPKYGDPRYGKEPNKTLRIAAIIIMGLASLGIGFMSYKVKQEANQEAVWAEQGAKKQPQKRQQRKPNKEALEKCMMAELNVGTSVMNARNTCLKLIDNLSEYGN